MSDDRTARLESTWIGDDLRRSIAALDDPKNLHRRSTDRSAARQPHDRNLYLVARQEKRSPIELMTAILSTTRR